VETKDKPWIKSYPKGLDWNFETPVEPLYAALDRAVADFPERPALHFLGRRYSYAELGAAVDRVAGALQARGLEKGDHVGLFLPNTPYYVIFYYAVLKAGGVVINFNPLYTQLEVERQVRDAGCRIMVTLDMAMMLPKLHRPVERGELDGVVVCSLAGALPRIKGLIFPLIRAKQLSRIPDSPAYLSYSSLLKERAPLLPVAIDPREDVAVLQYTGGTTGIPKAAVLTHRNLSANVQASLAWLRIADFADEVVLSALPFFHVFGMTICMNFPVGAALAMVILPNPRDIPAVVKAVTQRRVSYFMGVPAMFAAINDYPGIDALDISCVKYCFCGSAPLPVDVLQRFEALTGSIIVEGFGLTETSPVTHVNPLKTVRKVGSIGIPFIETDARIVDLETGTRELPPGEDGELAIKGPQVMQGYWNRPEETALVLRDGWLHTGDIARMDEDGYFYISGRKKDMIIVSGYNVYPDEVDAVLMAHPAVQECATIGVPDARRGELVKSFLVLKPGTTATAEEIVAYCRANLAAYKVPRAVEFRRELPKSPVLKILRRVLRDEELKRT
jgi:long-chain acyl-CoA synthetase